jgi:hypothetical protein
MTQNDMFGGVFRKTGPGKSHEVNYVKISTQSHRAHEDETRTTPGLAKRRPWLLTNAPLELENTKRATVNSLG